MDNKQGLCVFLPFIYFTSFREQVKVDINSLLQWAAPVGL